MDIRYSVNQRDVKRYTTDELRAEFLIEKLFVPGDVTATYSHVDRVITLGAMPTGTRLALDKNVDTWKSLGAKFFLAGRELGIINIGGPGKVHADGTDYPLGRREGLYLSMGTKEVFFSSDDQAQPAKSYMASAPPTGPAPRP